MTDLDCLREQIDLIDKEIISLFEKRMDAVALIGQLKAENGKAILDKSREETIICKNKSLVREDLRPFYEKLLRKYIEISKEYQEKIIKR